jgi:hypothetical protein
MHANDKGEGKRPATPVRCKGPLGGWKTVVDGDSRPCHPSPSLGASAHIISDASVKLSAWCGNFLSWLLTHHRPSCADDGEPFYALLAVQGSWHTKHARKTETLVVLEYGGAPATGKAKLAKRGEVIIALSTVGITEAMWKEQGGVTVGQLEALITTTAALATGGVDGKVRHKTLAHTLNPFCT